MITISPGLNVYPLRMKRYYFESRASLLFLRYSHEHLWGKVYYLLSPSYILHELTQFPIMLDTFPRTSTVLIGVPSVRA